MNTCFFSVVCLLALHYCIPAFAVDYDSNLESFAVPNHGELVFHVPVGWEINYVFYNQEKAVPPVVTFFARDEQGRELFQLNVSALWDDSFTRDVTDPANIRKLVEEVGQDILEYSDQNELVLEPFSGSSGEGYYFNVTDSSSRPGEYSYLTQGALAVGDVVLVFSLFTHDGDRVLKDKTLQMLRAVIQKHQRDVKTCLKIPHGREGAFAEAGQGTRSNAAMHRKRPVPAGCPDRWMNRPGDSYSYRPAPRALPANFGRSNATHGEF